MQALRRFFSLFPLEKNCGGVCAAMERAVVSARLASGVSRTGFSARKTKISLSVSSRIIRTRVAVTLGLWNPSNHSTCVEDSFGASLKCLAFFICTTIRTRIAVSDTLAVAWKAYASASAVWRHWRGR